MGPPVLLQPPIVRTNVPSIVVGRPDGPVLPLLVSSLLASDEFSDCAVTTTPMRVRQELLVELGPARGLGDEVQAALPVAVRSPSRGTSDDMLQPSFTQHGARGAVPALLHGRMHDEPRMMCTEGTPMVRRHRRAVVGAFEPWN